MEAEEEADAMLVLVDDEWTPLPDGPLDCALDAQSTPATLHRRIPRVWRRGLVRKSRGRGAAVLTATSPVAT